MPLTSLPNLLTLSRILVIPVVVATFYLHGDWARWFACALFSAAGVTDWLDGHMARRWQQQSELGRFLDPIADKLLVAATLFMLTTFGRLSAGAVFPALVILCREILVSGFARISRRLARWHAGLAACQVENDDPDGGDRFPARWRRWAERHTGRRDRRDVVVDCCAADLGDRLRLSSGRVTAHHAAAPSGCDCSRQIRSSGLAGLPMRWRIPE